MIENDQKDANKGKNNNLSDEVVNDEVVKNAIETLRKLQEEREGGHDKEVDLKDIKKQNEDNTNQR